LAAEVVQPPKALVAPVAIQQVVKLSEDIEEAWPGSQMEDFKEDKFRAIFEACGKTTKDKANKVDKTKLPELSAEEITRIGLPVVPTT